MRVRRAGRVGALQHAVEILAVERKIARVMEVIEALASDVETIDRDGRLGVLDAMGNAARVGQIKGVDFHQRHASALDLRRHMRLDAVVDRQFADPHAMQQREILERKLEKGELVALEIERRREAEAGARIVAARVQKLDPQINVAIRLRPVARGVVQRVRAMGGGRKSVDDVAHVSPTTPCARGRAIPSCRSRDA